MAAGADEIHHALMATFDRSRHDERDGRVVAAILALAMVEAAGSDAALCEGVGLDGARLLRLIGDLFPGAAVTTMPVADCRVAVSDEEQSLRDILWMYATPGSALARDLAAMVARRCACPHHLWQDLGLRDRTELSGLMRRHFAALAERNRGDMKWKKFLYRMICRAEGFSLCLAPVCSECNDFAACFGGEDGESLLARVRAVSDITA
ncbi:MAG: nitrogen fixation protein NifQ [Azospirillaceae bacterium]|nr:nitrogen fixation protein NifQ [Azospirillaceae bacterium]